VEINMAIMPYIIQGHGVRIILVAHAGEYAV
jgi:hypothetical protein